MPNPGSFQRAPSVNAEGTVFFSRGSKGCGGAVKIVKIAPDGTETILTQFPEGLDSRDTYAYTDEGGVTHVYYERFGCGKKTGSDIYQVMDPELTGSITIVKDAIPDDPTPFEFDPSSNLQEGNFFLDDGGAGSNQRTFTGLAAGTYTIQEVNVPSPWQIVDLSCMGDADGDTTTGLSLASINLDPGEHIVCTYTNARNGVTIQKDAIPEDPQDFEFDTDLQPTTFLLDDDPGSARPREVIFPNPPGQYFVTEFPDPPGWQLTHINCTDPDGGTLVDIPMRTVDIDLDAGEAILCTFENTKNGQIRVTKQTNPDASSQPFTFTRSYGANFVLSDGQTHDSGFTLAPGTYSVQENVPAGWRLTGTTCTDGSAPASIDLSPGESVTCTFTNTQDGRIVVTKQTDPNGSSQSFTFMTSYGPDFTLSDGQSNSSGFTLSPGTYSVSENAVAGWDLTSATCSDGSVPASITLSAGETVTCTFDNRQDGRIVVAKETTPDSSPQSFEFDTDYGPNFFLQDGQTNDSGFLDPGTYSVSELTPSGWDVTSATCSDGSSPGNINLSAGETVTCTFNNRQDGRIVVTKQTIPDGSPQNFTFSRSYGPDFVLSDGQSSDSGFTLNPGTYSVSETVPEGWTLTDASCSDGGAPGSINLSAGETVTCTFENTQQGTITIAKETNPDGALQSFEFDPSYGPNFFLSDGETNSSGNLAPGSYTVIETVPLLWDLGSIVCIDPDDGSSGNTGTATATIDLDPGEAVTCTFTNSLL